MTAERETPAGEAMREAVAQWFVASLGKSSEQGRRAADDLLSVAGPIASELARLTERAEKAETRATAAEKALVSLTPDGSEYYSRNGDVFVVDVGACMAFVTRAKDDKHNTIKRLIGLKLSAEAALTTLRADHAAEVARLKKAAGEYRDASGYLVQRYADLHAGKPVRDLQEASAHFASSAAALDALATMETTDA